MERNRRERLGWTIRDWWESILLVLVLFAFVGALMYLFADTQKTVTGQRQECAILLSEAGVEPQVIWEVCR